MAWGAFFTGVAQFLIGMLVLLAMLVVVTAVVKAIRRG